MNSEYMKLKSKAQSALRQLGKEFPIVEDAGMLIGAADTEISLLRNRIYKSIDVEWIEVLEKALPYIDIIVRNPAVMIEDVDEILPIELSHNITEKSIKHLAQHTNLILSVEGDEITPQKILNVYRDESYLTYENKFINTLLARLSAFVDKRYRALAGGQGTEEHFKFDYQTEFEHFGAANAGRNSARVSLSIELTSPLSRETAESDIEINERYKDSLARIEKINQAINSFRSSSFVRALGRNYIRPPVIRTNAILKNKNMKECLTLWEYIESFDKVGYSFVGDEAREMPSDDFVGAMYAPVALEYATFFRGVAEGNETARLLSEKPLFETAPEFNDEINETELEDYLVYDSEYRKTVPVSRLMNNRKKLSEDEQRIRTALAVALRADEILNAEALMKEAEQRRLAREKRLKEEEERRRQSLPRVEVLYRRSFLSRCIQTDDTTKTYYSEIKNALLSYTDIRSRISWSKESFRRGRATLAQIDVKGKTLMLRLALEPSEYENTKYKFKDVSDRSGGDSLPMLLKIKSERGKRYALELISELMAKVGLARTDRENENFVMPYEDTDALIAKGLVRVISKNGESLSENVVTVKGEFPKFEIRQKSEETPQAEEMTAEEMPEEEMTEEEIDGEGALGIPRFETRFRRSFMSRCIQTADTTKEFYSEVKNALLSYKGVKARISWSKESFRRGRVPLAQIDVRGKTLMLRLALDPNDYLDTKYRFKDVSDRSGGESFPMLLKIKSERGKRYALELISELMAKAGLARIDREAESFVMPYEDTDALIAKGLVRVITKGEKPEDAETEAEGESPNAEVCEEPIDEVNSADEAISGDEEEPIDEEAPADEEKPSLDEEKPSLDEENEADIVGESSENTEIAEENRQNETKKSKPLLFLKNLFRR